MEKKDLSWRFMSANLVMNSLYAPASAYAAVYLTSKGFLDAHVGMILAASNIVAIFLQQWLGKRIDRDEKWTLHEYTLAVAIPGMLIALSMLFTTKWLILLALQYILVSSLVAVVSPLLNSIGVMFMNQGFSLNYGLGRAGGSIGFALMSMLIGRLLTVYDTDIIMIATACIYATYVLTIFTLPIRENTPLDKKDLVANETIDAETRFMQRYPHYIFVFIGTVFFFMFHNLMMAYLIRFANYVGGNEDTLGLALMIQALIEIPILVVYIKLREYLSDKVWLFIAGIGFLLKALLMFLATSPTGIYAAMFSQILGYPLYVVSVIYYIKDFTTQADQTEGQVSIMTAQTIGTILGSLSGGVLIGLTSIPKIHLFDIFLCLAGSVCLWIGLFIKDKA